MINPLKAIPKALLAPFGLEIITRSRVKCLNKVSPQLLLYAALAKDDQVRIAKYIPYSHSQLAQDLFAICNSAEQNSSGFFVEFGATDGISMSNTFLLEKMLGWRGILAEPARVWHQDLHRNRSSIIDTRCVFPESGSKIPFLEVFQGDGTAASPELSSIKSFAENRDWASRARKNNSIEYLVETISLNDLLDHHDAPKVIDYMSIDTEGSEYEILKHFDFGARKILFLTVEHNYRKVNRELIRGLLEQNGYTRVLVEISQFDDWYVYSN